MASIEQAAAAEAERLRAAERDARWFLDQRHELWGRLGAYRAMADKLSGAEDPRLTRDYRQAEGLLVVTPCPLTAAADAVAQVVAVRARISGPDPSRLATTDLREAGRRLERLRLDTQRQESLAIEILGVALGWVTGSSATGSMPGAGGGRLLDCDLNERALRFGLEKSYRALARLTSRDDQRIELVDLANDVRPRTRF